MEDLNSFFYKNLLDHGCNVPNFGSLKNLIIKDPKFRAVKNFLKCLVYGRVFPQIALFDVDCFLV